MVAPGSCPLCRLRPASSSGRQYVQAGRLGRMCDECTSDTFDAEASAREDMDTVLGVPAPDPWGSL